MCDKINQELIEPHAHYLKKPVTGSSLYKIIKSHHFLDMLDKGYMYFNRVDQYSDDKRDSDQTNKDKELSDRITFEKNPRFTIANYYTQARERSYACCFTTEETNYIWQHYAGDDNNACCLVFNSDSLISFLNSSYSQSFFYHENFTPFLFLNYGLVTYGNLVNDSLTEPCLPNPVEYLYLKDNNYSEEKEFRITLLGLGIGNFLLPDGSQFDFPTSLRIGFNFRDALNQGAIKQLKLSQNHEDKFLQELRKKLKVYNVENLIL